MQVDARDFMSDAKFYESYSRWDDEKNRYETWDEAVDRVMEMHEGYYKPEYENSERLRELFGKVNKAYKEKRILGAQRALQFGGDQILNNPMRMYNCTASYADRAAFFGEIFHILLCGAGSGFSVQKHHVAKLPKIANRTKQAKTYVVEDSIEGWASSLDVLLSSYFVGGGKHPEYEGRRVYFDLSNIRPKGAKISGGFKAPGPEPLRKALDKIEHLIQGIVLNGGDSLRSIHVYDIVMHAADAVLAGGVRRSATICIFSPEDEEMINAKIGNWFDENPQRARSNNSALLVRSSATFEQFHRIMQATREFGEPGFIFAESTEHLFNPCVEIGLYAYDENGESGWQGCNLVEGNGAKCVTEDDFFLACEALAVIGTLQAGYTNFKFVSDATKRIFEREALLGVSFTGWMSNPDVMLNEETMRKGAQIVKRVNKEVAGIIGINPAARTTCGKPAGNASVLLVTPSGVHGEHAPRYLRIMQMNKEMEVAQVIKKVNPYMVEESVWSQNNSDFAVAFPIEASPNSRFKKDLHGVTFLEVIKKLQNVWVEEGTNIDLCVDPTLRHNISNTVQVYNNEWDEVEKYLFDNKDSFAGVSFAGESMDKDYNQAPNTEVLTEEEILEKYGTASFFASGLIVDSFKGFKDLWEATYVARYGSTNQSGERADMQADWIRRFKKFAENYFEGDTRKAEYCLKDVALLFKWVKIQQNLKAVDFKTMLSKKNYTDIDTMGAIACAGGACEI